MPPSTVIQVADATTVAAALIGDSPEAAWCADRLAEASLAAPHLMPFEVANVIRRTVTRGAIDAAEGAAALADLRQLRMDLVTFDVVAERAWELRDNLTTYDAAYVATAELLDCRLITLDRRLASAPGPRCEVLVPPTA